MLKNIFKILIIILIVGVVIMTLMSILGKSVTIEKNTSLKKPLENELKESLYYASLAPSSHNTQCWKVIIDTKKNELEVLIDKSKGLKEVDPLNRETLISVGAFIENLNKSLNAFGYETIINLDNDKSSSLAATIHYEKKGFYKNTSILKTIEKRHTDKSPFEKSNIPKENKKTLLLKYNKNLFFVENNSKEFNYIAKNTIEAFTKQSNTQTKREELSNWLRFSDKETLEKKDGLPAEQLGITGITKTFYYLFTNIETSKKDSFAKQGIASNKSQVENCSDFVVITGDNNKKDLLEVGRIMQSFWLDATENNIALHPISAILEETPYKNDIQKNLNSNKPIQMVFRAGKVKDYGENKKIRKDINDFVNFK